MKLQKTTLILSLLFLFLIFVAFGQKNSQEQEQDQERSPEYKIQFIGEDSCFFITPEKTYKCKISEIEYLIENYNL